MRNVAIILTVIVFVVVMCSFLIAAGNAKVDRPFTQPVGGSDESEGDTDDGDTDPTIPDAGDSNGDGLPDAGDGSDPTIPDAGDGDEPGSPDAGDEPGSPDAGDEPSVPDAGDEIEPEPPIEQPEPPIEFFDEEIETDNVAYVMDKTGSMRYVVGHSITDENGNVIGEPTKMQVVIAEFCKSVMKLAENIRFTALFYSASVEGAFWEDVPSPETPDLPIFSPTLVPATTANKLKAIAWANSFSDKAKGATPIQEACKRMFEVPEVKTVLLHTDGVPNCYEGEYWHDHYISGWEANLMHVINLSQQWIISNANTKEITVYTFGHELNSCPVYNETHYQLGEKFLIAVATGTGGIYTRVN